MARREVDKEDLLREATALVDRVELAAQSEPHEGLRIVAGFRADGAASLFFGADPVYHFNAAGELRRAYCDGLLVKAERGRLVSLRRERSAEEVQLIRYALSDAEQAEFLRRMQLWLHHVAQAIDAGEYEIVGQVGRDDDVVERVKQWLAGRDAIVIAAFPRA
jgi:hypothetical protein